MVEILLQFEKLQALNEKRIKDVDSEEYEVRETILKAIRKTFETVLKRWPSIAVEVLNKHLKFSGNFFLHFGDLKELTSTTASNNVSEICGKVVKYCKSIL